MLQSEKVKANQREVIELYHSCFPPEEKFPFDQLMNLSARGDVEFLAYYIVLLSMGIRKKIAMAAITQILLMRV